jgi:hypothetical protein
VTTINAAKLQTIRYLDATMDFITTVRPRRGDPPEFTDFGVPSLEEIGDPEYVPDDVLTVFLHLELDNLTSRLDRSDLWKTRLVLARTALSIQLYAEDHEGRFPRTLEQLVPHYAGQPPVSPITGERFEYDVSEGGFRLRAGEEAARLWTFNLDPVLDWSRSEDSRACAARDAPPQQTPPP